MNDHLNKTETVSIECSSANVVAVFPVEIIEDTARSVDALDFKTNPEHFERLFHYLVKRRNSLFPASSIASSGVTPAARASRRSSFISSCQKRTFEPWFARLWIDATRASASLATPLGW